FVFFFFQAEDGIRDLIVTGVKTCALPISLRGDDVVEHFIATSNHHWLLFFTTAGRVYRTKAYNLPEAQRDAKGGHVAGLLSFQRSEERRVGKEWRSRGATGA